jgi:molecular chaperone DnaK
MIKDAEAHAEEDKKFHELVQVRNQADTMIHATRKSLHELGDGKLEAGEKDRIEAAIKDLESVIKSEDKEGIEEKTRALAEASGKMAERLYAQQSADSEAGHAHAGAQGAEKPAAGGDDVVDAEFEEVKDDKR